MSCVARYKENYALKFSGLSRNRALGGTTVVALPKKAWVLCIAVRMLEHFFSWLTEHSPVNASTLSPEVNSAKLK